MFCTNCGHQALEDSKFCANCGNSMNRVATPKVSEHNTDKVKISDESTKILKKNRWFAGYLVAGLIYTFAQSFNKTTSDGVVILVVAILCGYFYHMVKAKLDMGGKISSVIITFVVLEIIAAASIGILTALMSRL